MVGHFVGPVIGNIADDNAKVSGRLQIDAVYADPVTGDDLTARQRLHHAPRHRRVHDDDSFATSTLGDELILGPAREPGQFRADVRQHSLLDINRLMVTIRDDHYVFTSQVSLRNNGTTFRYATTY